MKFKIEGTKFLIPILLSTLFGVALIIFSCNKKKQSDYYVRQELKDYGKFLEGSTWIYKDDSTGITDTVILDKNVYDEMVNYSDYNLSTERIIVSFTSHFLDQNVLSYECSPPLTASMTGYSDKLELVIKVSDSISRQYLAIWPGQQSGTENASPCHCPFGDCWFFKSEVISDYSLNNNNFQNVLHTYLRSSDTTKTNSSSFRRDFYFVKHVGLIKLREHDLLYGLNRSFSLIKWNVKQ